MSTTTSIPICRYGPACNRPNCTFGHPQVPVISMGCQKVCSKIGGTQNMSWADQMDAQDAVEKIMNSKKSNEIIEHQLTKEAKIKTTKPKETKTMKSKDPAPSTLQQQKCRFDGSCMRKNCPFIHEKGQSLNQVCKYDGNCHNPKCTYIHKEGKVDMPLCKFDGKCTRKRCTFRHEKGKASDVPCVFNG